ncbi:type IX secretion system PorP/SprF family membrane protein [Mucilaginibacter phyllosphaerae]|nr:type IX secretion system PorP/SprF family membrane protein [Mucilaginibacter phyllosphaerae]
MESYTDVKLGYRAQWAGIEGAPTTAFFSVNAPIGGEFIHGDPTSFESEASQNPFSRYDPSEYTASDPHHGIGMMVVSDKAGAITQTNLMGTYAYHLGISNRLNLSLGVSAGFTHQQINTALLTLKNQDDPTINNLNGNTWQPDVGLGLWAYSSNYFIGFSIQQYLNQKSFNNGNNPTTDIVNIPHYYFSAGVKIFLNDDISVTPSALLKLTQPIPVSFDLNTKFSFRNKFWLGAAYRRNDAITGMVGFNLNSLINLGYGYDINTSSLRTVNSGTHEIFIGLLLNNFFKLQCPVHGF